MPTLVTPTMPYEGRTLENMFGHESPFGRSPKLLLPDLAKSFEGQQGDLIILRLMLSTLAQMMQLHRISLVSAKRIRKRLELDLGVEPCRDDETALQCLKRLTDVIHLPATLVVDIDLSNPLQPVTTHRHQHMRLLHDIAHAYDRLELHVGFFRGKSQDAVYLHLLNWKEEYVRLELHEERVLRDKLSQLNALLRAWGCSMG